MLDEEGPGGESDWLAGVLGVLDRDLRREQCRQFPQKCVLSVFDLVGCLSLEQLINQSIFVRLRSNSDIDLTNQIQSFPRPNSSEQFRID